MGITLEQAAKRFTVAGLDMSALKGQEEAFQTCFSFLRGIETTKTQNNKHGSYGLKHIVENPTGRFGIPSSTDCYNGYVYEGTFILAALASGFTMRQNGEHLKVTFNISERSLRQRAKAFASRVA